MDFWTVEAFSQFCVLCGCDYREPDVHIKGCGIKTAFKLINEFDTPESMLTWMWGQRRWQDKFPHPLDEYLHHFHQVVAVFWHHWVFDSKLKECVSIAHAFPGTCRNLPDVDLAAVCGTPVSKAEAFCFARGELGLRSREQDLHETLCPADQATLTRIRVHEAINSRQCKCDQPSCSEATGFVLTEAAFAAAANSARSEEAESTF